jgi:hypothetical protein
MNSGATIAQFDLKVERKTVNITKDLPFVLLGKQFLSSKYQSILPLPNGLSLEVTQGTLADADKILFNFTDTASLAEDVIEISSSTNPYPDILEASITDLSLYDRIKMTLSSGMDTEQFNNRLEFLSGTMFGAKNDVNIVPSSEVNPNQNQDRQVNIPVNEKVDAKRAILSRFRQEAGTIQFNFYVYKAAIWNAKALARL